MRRLRLESASMTSTFRALIVVLSFVGLSVGCGGGVSSDEEARRAYLGLDQSIGKSLQLGFDGFNSASSANIDPQATTGYEDGTLTITGQVDQGSSDNKGMRLYVGMVDYFDGAVTLADNATVEIVYQTDADVAAQPYLVLTLRNIPTAGSTATGDFTGSLTGHYLMSGDLDGEVQLNLSMSGLIQDDGTGKVVRTAESTHVVGTATAGAGTYNVDLTL
jgi:hypothetical protein